MELTKEQMNFPLGILMGMIKDGEKIIVRERTHKGKHCYSFTEVLTRTLQGKNLKYYKKNFLYLKK